MMYKYLYFLFWSSLSRYCNLKSMYIDIQPPHPRFAIWYPIWTISNMKGWCNILLPPGTPGGIHNTYFPICFKLWWLSGLWCLQAPSDRFRRPLVQSWPKSFFFTWPTHSTPWPANSISLQLPMGQAWLAHQYSYFVNLASWLHMG